MWRISNEEFLVSEKAGEWISASDYFPPTDPGWFHRIVEEERMNDDG